MQNKTYAGTVSFYCRLVGNTAMIFASIILEYIYDWYEVLSGVGNYLKYKVAETRNNSLVRVKLSNLFLILIF